MSLAFPSHHFYSKQAKEIRSTTSHKQTTISHGRALFQHPQRKHNYMLQRKPSIEGTNGPLKGNEVTETKVEHLSHGCILLPNKNRISGVNKVIIKPSSHDQKSMEFII